LEPRQPAKTAMAASVAQSAMVTFKDICDAVAQGRADRKDEPPVNA
jgi:hypothetical protein